MRPDAKDVSEESAENDQRDDAAATHRSFGLRIADCKLKEFTRGEMLFPKSKIRRDQRSAARFSNPKSSLSPLPISSSNLPQKLDLIQALACSLCDRA